MHTIVKLFIALLLTLLAQFVHGRNADETAIEQAAVTYVQSHHESDQAQMERAVYHEVGKKHVRQRENFERVTNIGHSELVSATKLEGEKYAKLEDENLKVDVKLLDINGKIASIKVSTNQYDFYDYMHLAKINGEWKIINVLWDNRKVE